MTTQTIDPITEIQAGLVADYTFSTLTLNDRCDADASEAAVAQVRVNGTTLLFCGHHWREHAHTIVNRYPYSVPDAESFTFTDRNIAAHPREYALRDAGSAATPNE